LRYSYLTILLLVCWMLFSSIQVNAQSYYKNKSYKRKGKNKAVEFKRNVLYLEGLGSSQVVGVKYERILMFGSVVSMRLDLGITPFVLDENYNFIAGRSITPITGLGFYFHVIPFPVRIGVGCSVLHDIYFNGIPEIQVDTTGGVTNPYPNQTYRARVMPYAVVEATIKDRITIKAGYTPIIDPANEAQTELYFTHWATFGVGYKFGK
jgi:hypothetical protein